MSWPTPDEARRWELVAPGTFERIMAEIEREEEHKRRMEVTEWRFRISGQRCAFGTVAVLAVLAAYFMYRGAPTQGAAIIVTGAVSIVAVFLGNRLGRDVSAPGEANSGRS